MKITQLATETFKVSDEVLGMPPNSYEQIFVYYKNESISFNPQMLEELISLLQKFRELREDTQGKRQNGTCAHSNVLGKCIVCESEALGFFSKDDTHGKN